MTRRRIGIVLLGGGVLGKGQESREADERRRELAWRVWQQELERLRGRREEKPEDWLRRDVGEFVQLWNKFEAKLTKGEVDWAALRRARRQFEKVIPWGEACVEKPGEKQ